MAGHNWLFVLRIKRSKQGKANKNSLYINEQPAKVGNKMKRYCTLHADLIIAVFW
jgi:hypothetical protein